MKPVSNIFPIFSVCILCFAGCRSAPTSQIGTFQNQSPATVVNKYAAPSSRTSIVPINSANELASLLQQSPGIVLVDFYADWCGPCRKQSKILDEVTLMPSNTQCVIAKVNVDENPELSEQFGVSGLPTLIAFKNGSAVRRKSGLADHETVWDLLQD